MDLAFFTLSQIDSHLQKYASESISNIKFSKNDDELWIGWIFGKFITSRIRKECLLGLPVKENAGKLSLYQILKDNLVEDKNNFDVAIIAKDTIKNGKIVDGSYFYRIQIKRYKSQNPNTDDFINFVKDKFLNHYAPDKGLNCVILMEPGFKIDKIKLEKFVNNSTFNLANIWITGYYYNQKFDPYLMPIFPKFTKEIWRPST